MSKFLSILAVFAMLITVFAGTGVFSAAAEGKDYVVVLEDFENADRVKSYLPVPPQNGTMIQTKSTAYKGTYSGLFVNSAAYGAVKDNANYANKVMLTYDNQLMAEGQANTFDAFRIYIKNPGEDVTFRMQFVTALGNTFFQDTTVKHSEEFLAYDFPLKDCRKNSMESNDFFGGETDPFNAQIWEILFVYVSDTLDLKLYVDDLSLVKYNFSTPVTTQSQETVSTTASTQPATVNTTVSTAPVVVQTTTTGAVATTTTNADVVTEPSGGFPTWGIVLIVVGVVVVAGGAGAAWWFLKKKKASSRDTE